MKKYLKLLLTLVVFALLYSCKKDNPPKEEVDIDITTELNVYISSLTSVPQDEVSAVDSTESEDISFDQDSIIYACKTTVIKK